MYTRQKVSAALRKSGMRAAKWNRSGMIRGWGDWSSGFRVVERDDVIQVGYQFGRHQKNTDELEKKYLQDASKALSGSNIEHVLEPSGLCITVRRMK